MNTVKQVAAKLNLSPRAIYRAVECGELEHHRFGSQIRVSEEQLRAYMERARIKAEPKTPDVLRALISKHLDA